MQILNQKNNVNFTSRPIHCVNIRDADNKLVKVVFSKLDPKCGVDKAAIKKLQNSWEVPHELMKDFYAEFSCPKDGKEFNAIELPGIGPLHKKILGVVYSKTYMLHNQERMSMPLLITNPDLKHENGLRKLKGIGEIMLGEVFNRAKKTKAPELEFNSEANKFFRKFFSRAKVKITDDVNYNPYNSFFHIGQEDFDKCIDWCQKKHKTNFSATI